MSDTAEKTEFEKILERKVAESNTVPPEEESLSDNATAVNDDQSVVDDSQPTPKDTEALNKKLEEQSSECEQLKDQLLRVRADFDNYRKRMLREMNQIRQTASANLIRALLPALDNLERALAHASAEEGFVEGVGMVYKQFQEVLASEGLEPLPALHEIFDPNVHDALATMPSESVEAGRIMEEYERGYRLRDTVLRPARVVVSSGSPDNVKDENLDQKIVEETVAAEESEQEL
jgi:molecular chaperone GrpE